MTMMSLSNTKISSLQSVRFLFAAMIFCHHYFTSYVMHEQLGLSAVTFFFILSGFVSSIGYSGKVLDGTLDYKRFVKSRILKLAPLNLVCLFLWFAPLFCNDVTTSDYHILRYCSLVVDALMIQSWIPFEWGYFSGNAVAWFLSSVFFCYLVFPFMVSFLKKYKYGMIPVIALYLILLPLVPEKFTDALLYVNPLFRLLDFSLGIGLFFLLEELVSRVNVKKGFLVSTILELAAISLFVGSFFLLPIIDIKYATASLFWIPSIILIAIMALNDYKRDGGGVLYILQSQMLTRLGGLSFPIYMSHYIFVQWWWKIAEIYSLNRESLFGAMICFSSALLFALLFNKIIEPNTVSLLRK